MEFERVNETEVGYAAGTTERFLSKLTSSRVCLHSLLLMRSGKVFAEEYAPGYDENFRHRLYSSSKTYVSAAIGTAIGEGLLTLDTKIADYFPDKLPEKPHPYITNLTVRDCLIMATPFDETPYRHEHTDWVKDFFTEAPTHRGGTIFHYDTGATLVLDALVERVSRLPFNEYLYDRVLRHIGYSQIPECVEAPDGTKWGGSGMLCTTREFAAFAQLFVRGGKAADGRQLIPEWYIQQATSKQIGNAENNKNNAFYGHGYGYQVWMTRTGWAMFGMGNQLALYAPKEDVLLICTGDDQGNDYARSYIAEYMEELFLNPLGSDYSMKNGGSLCLPLPIGKNISPLQKSFSRLEYRMEKNDCGIERISFEFDGNNSRMTFFAQGEEKVIPFGLGHYVQGEFPEKKYSGMRINTPLNRGYRCFAAAAWDLPDLLVMKCYAADTYFGNFVLNVRFSADGIDLRFDKKAEWFMEEYDGFASGSKLQEK